MNPIFLMCDNHGRTLHDSQICQIRGCNYCCVLIFFFLFLIHLQTILFTFPSRVPQIYSFAVIQCKSETEMNLSSKKEKKKQISSGSFDDNTLLVLQHKPLRPEPFGTHLSNLTSAPRKLCHLVPQPDQGP